MWKDKVKRNIYSFDNNFKMMTNTSGLPKLVEKNGMKTLVLKIITKHFQGVLICKQIKTVVFFVFCFV